MMDKLEQVRYLPTLQNKDIGELLASVEKSVESKANVIEIVSSAVRQTIDLMDSTSKKQEEILRSVMTLRKNMSETQLAHIDEANIEHSVSLFSSRLNSLNTEYSLNCQGIDKMIVEILKNLAVEIDQDMKSKINLHLVVFDKIDKSFTATKREDLLQLMYDFLKKLPAEAAYERASFRHSVFHNEIDLIQPFNLLVANPEAISGNPYKEKILLIQDLILKDLAVCSHKSNSMQSKINQVQLSVRGIGQIQAIEIRDQIEKLERICAEAEQFEKFFYSVINRDLALFDGIIGKSYQFMNRKVQAGIKLAAESMIDAKCSLSYLKLAETGSQQLPFILDGTMNNLRVYLGELMQQNLDQYLLMSFKTEESEKEILARIIDMNQNESKEAVDQLLEVCNVYLEEVRLGRSRNGLNNCIFNQVSPKLIRDMSIRLSLIQDYK